VASRDILAQGMVAYNFAFGMSVRTIPPATSPPTRLAVYAELAKIRLIALVLVTTAVGFAMADAGPFWSVGLVWTLLGTGLAAAGAMALNQWLETERDALMERTRHRPLPAGLLSRRHALLFGLATAAVGLAALAVAVNLLTALLGLLVVVLYAAVYTPLKTRTPLCTLAGAVCGAIPPMMGWSAAAGRLGFGAWLLGFVLFLWQIPHFLALAWLYRDDYRRGGFRMLPVVDPDGRVTAAFVMVYTAALLPVTVAAVAGGLAGRAYGAGAVILGALFLAAGGHLALVRSAASARRLFLASLLYLPLLLGMMVIDRRPVPGARAAAGVAARVVPAVADPAAAP
jgi:protoheme IX farnesyltransferase